MMDRNYLYDKLSINETFTDEECEWLTYYESLKSRSDSDHDRDKDPLVGALIRDEKGHVLAISHRASGQEGNHAEYVLIMEKLAGQDLSNCHLFTTLEPCVDDSRHSIGSSCSSIICKSEIKNVHIGILDPNPVVKERGLAFLFNNGVDIHCYSKELVSLIYNSCKAFKSKTKEEINNLLRFKKDILPYFDNDALSTYLKDLAFSEKGINEEEFVFDDCLNEFILELIRKSYVSFSAKTTLLHDSIKLLFYQNDYLPFEYDRQIKIINSSNPNVDSIVDVINEPLPKLFHSLEEKYSNLSVNKEAFREAIANLIIHKTYDRNRSLGYIEISGVDIHIKNEASSNLDYNQLRKLCEFKAESKPGDGIIADYFNRAHYCERSKKGQKTFSELGKVVSISVNENNFVDVCLKFF